MKRWIKIFAIAAAFLMALVIALIILASVLITPDRVKSALLPLAEQKLHRKIELGEIKVSLFSGIEIYGLRVLEPDGRETFLATDLVRLRYQLLPLLAMKVVVDEVRLEKPSIRLVRWKNGQFNFSDLTTNEAGEGSRPLGPSSSAAGNPVSLLVSHVLLQDGQVVFFDHVLNDKVPYRFEIADLQLTAKGVVLTGEVPLSLQCQLNGSPLSIEGRIIINPLGGEFQVKLANLDVVPFFPYFQDSLPGNLGSLKVDADASAQLTPGAVSLKGTLVLQDLDLVLEALRGAPVKKARVAADYDLLADLTQKRLDIHKLALDYNGFRIDAKGTVAEIAKQPAVELALMLPKQQVSMAFRAVPEELVGGVNNLDPTGMISGEASLAGEVKEPAKLLKSALLDLEDVQVSTRGQRPAFSGRLRLSGDRLVSENLRVRLGDNTADLALSAQKIFARPVVVGADITAERFLLEPLLLGSAGSAAATGQAGLASDKPSPSDELGPFNIPLQASGTIKVAEALWKGLTINDFLARYELRDNILRVARMDGTIGGGTFSNTAHIDLGKKGLVYQADIGLKGVQTDPLLTALTPRAAGSILGAMDLVLKLDGRGTRWDGISRSLSGEGNLLVNNGRLVSPGLVKGFGNLLQLPDLNDIQFKNLVGTFRINSGKVRIESQMTSDSLKVFPQGDVGLDGALNLALDTRLSPALAKRVDAKGAVLGYLADSEGWARIPLLLHGTLAAPAFSLDPKGFQEQASKAISGELGRQIDRLLRKQEPPAARTGEQPSGKGTPSDDDPARKLLEDSLQKLFGN